MNTIQNNFLDQVMTSMEDSENFTHLGYQIVDIDEEPGFYYESIPMEDRDPSLSGTERRGRRYIDDIGSLERATSGSFTVSEVNGVSRFLIEIEGERDSEDDEDSDSEDSDDDDHSSLNSTNLSFDEDSETEYENDDCSEDEEYHGFVLTDDEMLGLIKTLSDVNVEKINIGFPEMNGADQYSDNCELHSLERGILSAPSFLRQSECNEDEIIRNTQIIKRE
ncbi:unnamed protein product [Lepeophtheirus salmonis]|uniref:(salmon louse) hypothetical protein n=1 Tax=Lepeophtheirus salmonis TaxID=72036 RepID=A0A7R8H3P2_LEPSM|nr:unnamed protein product [Lepeophtheirus salmonis]CAF2836689.1 unnamed protein product [Lepeophtheirus salmonis]